MMDSRYSGPLLPMMKFVQLDICILLPQKINFLNVHVYYGIVHWPIDSHRQLKSLPLLQAIEKECNSLRICLLGTRYGATSCFTPEIQHLVHFTFTEKSQCPLK